MRSSCRKREVRSSSFRKAPVFGRTGAVSSDERSVAQVFERLRDLLLGVHHERPVACDRLPPGLPPKKEKPDGDVLRVDDHAISIPEHRQTRGGHLTPPSIAIVTEDPLSFEHISKSGVPLGNVLRE